MAIRASTPPRPMYCTPLIAIVASLPISSDPSGSLAALFALLSSILFTIAGWRIFKKEDGSAANPELESNDPESIGDRDQKTESLPSSVPKPKTRGKRWKSVPDEEATNTATGSDQDELQLERQRVASLSARLKIAESELHSLRQELKSPESNAKNRQVLLEKNKAIAERNKAQERLQRYKDKVSELERVLEENSSSKIDMSSVRDSTGLVELEFERKLVALEAEKSSLSELLEKAQFQMEQAEKEGARARVRCESLEVKLRESQDDSDELCQKIDELQNRVDTTEHSADEQEKEKGKLQELVGQLESDLKRGESRAQEWEAKHELVLGELTERDQEKQASLASEAELQAQLQSAQFQVSELNQSLESHRLDSDAKNDHSNRLQDELNELKSELKTAVHQNGNLIRDIDTAARANVEWELKFTELERVHKNESQRFVSLEQRCEELEACGRELEEEKSQLLAESNQQKLSLTELETLHRESGLQAQQALETARAEQAATDERHDVLKAELEQLSAKIEELKGNEVSIESEHARQTEELQVETRRLSELIASKDRELETVALELSRGVELMGQVESRAEEAGHLEVKLNQVQEEHQASQSRVIELQDQLASLQLVADEAPSNESLAAVQSEMEELRIEKARLNSQLKASAQSLQVGIEEREKLQSRLDEYQNEVFQRDTEIESLKNVEAHHSQMSAEKQELQLERDELQQKLLEFETLQKQLRSQVRRLEQSEARVLGDFKALKDDRDQIKARRKKVSRKYRQLHERFATTQADFSVAQRDNAQLEQQLLHAQKQNDLLAQQVTLLETNAIRGDSGDGDSGAQLVRLQRMIGQLGDRLAASHEKYKKLAIQYRKTRSRYKRYKDRLVSYKDLLERYRDTSDRVPEICESIESISADLAERDP